MPLDEIIIDRAHKLMMSDPNQTFYQQYLHRYIRTHDKYRNLLIREDHEINSDTPFHVIDGIVKQALPNELIRSRSLYLSYVNVENRMGDIGFGIESFEGYCAFECMAPALFVRKVLNKMSENYKRAYYNRTNGIYGPQRSFLEDDSGL